MSPDPVDDDWQLISAPSGSSIPSSSSRQAGSRPTQQQAPHHQQTPTSSTMSSQHQSPVKGSGDVQNFPELASLSNEELAALLVDDTKYGSLVDNIMAKSSVAQVWPLSCLLLPLWFICISCLAETQLTVLLYSGCTLRHLCYVAQCCTSCRRLVFSRCCLSSCTSCRQGLSSTLRASHMYLSHFKQLILSLHVAICRCSRQCKKEYLRWPSKI